MEYYGFCLDIIFYLQSIFNPFDLHQCLDGFLGNLIIDVIKRGESELGDG